MSTVAVLPPFPFFTGRSGEPLDAGFVYVGAEDQDPVAVPIAIFWDSALTISAPNPVRTSAGYLSRSGSPGVLFAASNYSMRVADKNNTQLYVLPSSARVGLGDITLSSGETLRAEAGSQILVRDGANLSIGDNTGVGANTIYADSARFVGNFIPRSNGTQKIGDTDKRVDVFADAVDATTATLGATTIGNVQANGNVLVAAGKSNGSVDAPWTTVNTLALTSDNLAVYRTAQPTDNATLIFDNARARIVAAGGYSLGTGLAKVEKYNITTITGAAGSYIVNLSTQISVDCSVVVTCQGAGFISQGSVGAGGTTLAVSTFNSSGALVASSFSVIVVGPANSAGAAGILSPF